MSHKGIRISLTAYFRKCVFIDKKAAAKGEPAWVIRVFEDELNWRDYHCEDFIFKGTMRPMGSKDKPLTPEGPAFWLETNDEIILP
jgi:hypothetical protein